MAGRLLYPAVAALFTMAASAQSGDPPKFEAADIHASAPRWGPAYNFMQGPYAGGGRFEVRNATLLDLIRLGWDVPQDKIVGGPDWIGRDRFDIVAKAPADAKPADIRSMLQAVLTDGFNLKIHDGTKPMPALALVVAPGKKPHLKEAAGAGPSGCKPQTSAPGQGSNNVTIYGTGPNGSTTLGILPGNLVQFNCRNMTMAAFAAGLQGILGSNVGQNPVSDDTDLKGAWDFEIKYSLIIGLPTSGSGERISFGDALEKQLGLKLEKREVPKPVTFIDSATEPAPNPPGTKLSLPVLPAEFEAATIKPTPPDFHLFYVPAQRGGRVNIQDRSLKLLLMRAWGLSSPDLVIGAPKFAETDRYDITAEAATYGPESEAAPGGAGARFQSIDPDSINLMLRNLLIQRFKIQYHTEEQPATAFVLTAVKPKLMKADPANHSGFHGGPGADGKDPRITHPGANQLWAFENTTMQQFVRNLALMENGYTRGAIIYDETGLDGAFDFTLNFTDSGFLAGAPRAGSGGGDGAAPVEAAAPSGMISLFDAIEKQLGLKLEQARRPTTVLVIDHIEPKPIEN